MIETRNMPAVEIPGVAPAALATPTPRPMLLPATDGLNLFLRRWFPDSSAPKAIVQIAHGVAEHSGRYARLAAALTGAGFGVYARSPRARVTAVVTALAVAGGLGVFVLRV
jgi:predicted alpha/beta hydrolase